MLRMQAMTANGSGIDGIARCRGPSFVSDQTTVCCVEVVGWQVSETGGSRICTLCDLLDLSALVTLSPSLVTSSVSNDDVTAAAAELLASAHSTDVLSTDILQLHTLPDCTPTIYTYRRQVHRCAKGGHAIMTLSSLKNDSVDAIRMLHTAR